MVEELPEASDEEKEKLKEEKRKMEAARAHNKQIRYSTPAIALASTGLTRNNRMVFRSVYAYATFLAGVGI